MTPCCSTLRARGAKRLAVRSFFLPVVAMLALLLPCTRVSLFQGENGMVVAENNKIHKIKADTPSAPLVNPNSTQQQQQQQQLRLPGILLIGAQKAGTSALAKELQRQPEICAAKVFPGEPQFYKKEVHFFSNIDRFRQGTEFYAKRFEHCPEETIGFDGTPEYQGYEERIYETYKNASKEQLKNLKMLFILREPVARELSWYNDMHNRLLDPDRHHLSCLKNIQNPTTGETLSFEKYIRRKRLPLCKRRGIDCRGLYADALKRWFRKFDRSQILVLSYDELAHDVPSSLRRVQTFLGLKAGEMALPVSNSKHFPQKLKFPSCSIQKEMADFFETENQDLYSLLESNPGPPMEERPFPRFKRGTCSA